MLLKKQTVWLLTMLSLVVVLSVYYITTPNPQSNMTTVSDDPSSDVTDVSDQDAEVITNAAGDEVFEALRLDLQDKRNELREELTMIVASDDVSAEEKNKAYEQMQQLNEMAQKELILETLIKSMNYEDALVRVEGNKVHITVKAKESSKEAANEILRLVQSELGNLQVASVQFQSAE
ncbi:SpoIIIAH-like family protein [Aeribacillus pallidus]|jgi:stage III sporulation protein AH|uniref:SpoIIIAH-like family protein n=1 Tax=Aeribacillus pallidus TaxID=33936 RepID=UPI001DE403D7|nr:SpoIIIAH-like family protein [Bacillus sp. (in: firmicutes)]